jgi:uncharacterized protein
MEMNTKTKMLRIYVSNTDKVKHDSLYETIAFGAKHFGLAGITVYKGIMGYGASNNLSSAKFWSITEKVPVIVEIVDEESKINAFLEKILPLMKILPKGCLITCQDADVVLVKYGEHK